MEVGVYGASGTQVCVPFMETVGDVADAVGDVTDADVVWVEALPGGV